MAAAYARDGELIRPGQVYIAPGDHHLLVRDGRVRVTRGPRENGFRPAVDPLFRTAADQYGPQVIGIVLSGGLDDGSNGLALIKRNGGIAIVQHLDDAFVNSMPLNAMRTVEVDYVVPAADMTGIITRLVNEARPESEVTMPTHKNDEPDYAERGFSALEEGKLPGPPSGFTCPECGGALWELKDGEMLRFSCHVGHSYSPETLLNDKAAALEPVLWTALRALEENGEFLRRMAERARAQRLENIAEGYSARAEEIERRAHTVRSALVDQTEPLHEAAELTRANDEMLARAAVSETGTALAEEAVGRSGRRGPPR
jgi:two-component system chemotaxis response regulator CheB